MTDRPSVAIIGGGISGLTAGIFAIKYGFNATIYERNTSVGGLCTGWNRKGTHIDGCIHWLTESNRGVLHKLWKETGAVDETTNVYHYQIYSQAVRNGKTISFYTNPDKLQEELLKHCESRNDEKLVKLFVKAVRRCKRNALTVEEPFHLWNWWDKLKFIWKIRTIIPVVTKFAKLSIREFADQFQSKDLQYAFRNTLVPDEYSLFSLMSTFGGISSQNSGIALGGSKAMVERMKDNFIALGGTLKLNADVDHIDVQGDIATGVVMKNKNAHVASEGVEKYDYDYIIPACDIHHVLVDLFSNKFTIDTITERDLDKERNPTYSMIMLSLRTKKNLDGVEFNRYVNCREYQILGKTFDTLYMKHFGYDKNLVDQEGHTVVQAIVTTDESMFDALQAMTKEEYKQFKKDVGVQLMAKIYEMDGDMYGQLELLDVVTPVTFTHYVNAYKGTFMTYMLTKNNRQMIIRNNVIPLKNVALAGHWVMVPGGVPIAAMQGKFAAYTIAHAAGLIR